MAGLNYGEELAYWYLRLNGFFPIRDFVVHRVGDAKRASDCDLLALRSPLVYEEIGGNRHDWEPELLETLCFDKKLYGVICEVKTGAFETKRLFPRRKVEYLIGRLGLFPREEIGKVAAALDEHGVVDYDGIGICKLLITASHKFEGVFIHRSLQAVREFIKERVRNYPKEKFADRLFFPSELFQYLIDEVGRENASGQPNADAAPKTT